MGQKGSSFERDMAKKFSKWWTGGETDDVFWRSSGSGARATSRTKQGKKTTGHYGDMSAVDDRGTPFIKFFTVEMKKGYAKANIHDWLDGVYKKVPELIRWMKKTKKSAKQAGSITWILITKRNNKQTLIWMPIKRFEQILDGHDLGKGPACVIANIDGVNVIAMALDVWMEIVTPKMVQDALNDHLSRVEEFPGSQGPADSVRTDHNNHRTKRCR